MEGIFGIFSFHGQVEPQRLRNMAIPLGLTPKTEFYTDGKFGMGMKRLPLIARIQRPQPFLNADGSLCVAINGEINNYQELRQDLERRGYGFVSDSDAELVASLYQDKGDDFLRELNGLFAIAICDRHREEIVLALDRYAGIRQLYYAQLPDEFIFASSIRPILGSGRLTPEVDTDSLVEFFSIGYVLPPRCLFKGIRKLIPGHILKCRQGDVSSRRVCGFSFTPEIEAGDSHRLEELFSESMGKNLTADRPPAFLLSGGLDTSLNVAMASRLCGQPLDTVSIGFSDKDVDESAHARLVAEHFKTNHHEQFLESSNALEIVPQLVWSQEEPLSDYSAVPSFHLARFAKNSTDVVIAGDGPDHLWGRQYNLVERFRLIHSLPGHHILNKLFTTSSDGILSKSLLSTFFQRLAYYANKTVASAYLEEQAYCFGNPSCFKFVPPILSKSLHDSRGGRVDLNDLLSDDIPDDFRRLVTCDFIIDGSFGVFSKFGKVAAEHSLLVREPYLDNALVDYINRLPEAFKIRGSLWQRLRGTAERKYLMRHDLGHRLLPQATMSKAKAGFAPPMRKWLQEYFDRGIIGTGTLLSSPLRQAGLFDITYVNSAIEACRKMSIHNSFRLYMLLTFVVWYRLYIEGFNPAGPSVTLTELLNG